MSIIYLLKKIPIDIGQAQKKHTTAGKRIAFSLIDNGVGKKALDIGCRDGYWSIRLDAHGYEVVSLDIEPFYEPALTHDVEDGLPFEDASFDLIWCTEVIEHLYHPEAFLQEIERVLKPHGKAILTTPNSAWFFYPIVKLWGWTPKKLQNPDHKQFFSYKDISRIAPTYKIFGYFPYMFIFFRIASLVGFLSPTFIFFLDKDTSRGR